MSAKQSGNFCPICALRLFSKVIKCIYYKFAKMHTMIWPTFSSGSDGGVGLSNLSSDATVFSRLGVDFFVLISFPVPTTSPDFGLCGTKGILKMNRSLKVFIALKI